MRRRRLEEVELVGGEVVFAHFAGDCLVAPCPIHSASQHHMSEWRQHWRADRGIIERICPHGVGHPDPDGMFDPADGVHGCDGCCRPPDKPWQ